MNGSSSVHLMKTIFFKKMIKLNKGINETKMTFNSNQRRMRVMNNQEVVEVHPPKVG